MFLGKQYCGGSGSSGGTLISVVLAVAILAHRQRQRPQILAADGEDLEGVELYLLVVLAQM